MDIKQKHQSPQPRHYPRFFPCNPKLLFLGLLLLLVWFKMNAQSHHDKGSALFGVYHPVDVSTYSEIYPENPGPAIQEIAKLYSELIRQFISMRYLNAEDVHFPPHTNPRVNLSLPAKYGLTKDVVDLYQMIPYVTAEPNWNYGSDHGEFIMGGEFLEDLRKGDADCEQQIIDPTYGIDHLYWELSKGNHKQSSWDDENGPYIRPWYAVLSSCGNHGSIMVLDTKTHNMWLVWQLEGSSDPFFTNGDHSTYGEPKTSNVNDLQRYPSRSATEFLRDMIKRFKSLEWIPGGLYSPEYGREYESLKAMYRQAGWPDAFDRAEFDRLRDQFENEEADFRRKTQPLNRLEDLRARAERESAAKATIEKLQNELRISEERYARSGSTDDKNRMEEQRRTLDKWRQRSFPASPEQWAQSQTEIQKRIDELKQEQLLLNERKGRFAGLSDEDHEKILADRYYEKQIEMMEELLADKDQDARVEREERNARLAARMVSQEVIEKWIERQIKWGGKNDEWRKKWEHWYSQET
ncbi:uncharacterized protein PV09_03164 [Verruconis gallopava]|uniref:Knr4/Smi1-like domain-containing protein n=1 Tax=Verruconis gallopava TaxID=253628 RepID=A0A0D2AHF5_9PEZI|nr:uncharacterized protein PV09_03164 [Verruconis gallopava]KIW05980.1 hypothetical protein PV09_03164 [Verruconis gallopava]